jgi:predicted membrane protein (TIGR00267 family)
MAFVPWVREKVDLLQHYHRVSEVGAILRRYFALNAFDGVLTTLGVLMGSLLGGVTERGTIVTLVLTTAIGMSVSGFYGSYLVERAERGRALKELEGSTLSSLEDTDISAASHYAAVVVAIVDGASPFAAAALCTIPFWFGSALPVRTEYYLALGVAFLLMFLLGAFLGYVSRERLVLAGLRFMIAGGIALALSFVIEGGLL